MNTLPGATPADDHPIGRHAVTDDDAGEHLAAGRAVQIGNMTMTAAADGSSFTLTDPVGRSSTFTSLEEFDTAITGPHARRDARVQAIHGAARAWADGCVREAALTPRQAAVEAHQPGGPAVDELEQRIRAWRQAHVADRGSR